MTFYFSRLVVSLTRIFQSPGNVRPRRFSLDSSSFLRINVFFSIQRDVV